MKSILDKGFKYRDSVTGHTPEAFARRMKAYGRLVRREATKAKPATPATVTPIAKRKERNA